MLAHLTVHSRYLETETLRCQSTVSSVEAQVAKNPQLIGMLGVERRKSKTLQAEVLRHGAEKLQPSQH